MEFWSLLSFLLIFSLLGMLAMIVPILRMEVSSASWAVVISILCANTLGIGVASWVNTRFNGVEVNERGVRLTAIVDVGRYLNWDQITRIRPIRWLWLPYLRLDTPRKTYVLWLPLFLKDKAGFRRAVTELAPPNNELRRWVENNPNF
jgi:hypothetical protein